MQILPNNGIDVSVIIVNYNTADLITKCVKSLLCQLQCIMEIIVVDNQSQDNSLVVLQEFGSKLTLIANTENKGFGKANNQAFQVARGKYLFLLNPDAMCLTQLDVYQVLQYMDQHPDVGLAGTRILDAKSNLTTTVFYHYPRENQSKAYFAHLPGKIASVLGASMVIRRDVFEKAGGFDERFFLYAEETDLCLRIRKLGYSIGYCDAAIIQHIGSASERGNPPEEVSRKMKMGKLLFYQKHYPRKDVIKIIKKEIKNTRRHLLRLKFLKHLFGLNPTQEIAYRRHHEVYQVTKTFLDSV